MMVRRCVLMLAGLSAVSCVIAVCLWVQSWVSPRCLTVEAGAAAAAATTVRGSPWPEWSAMLFSTRGGLDLRYYWRSGSPPSRGAAAVWSLAAVRQPQRPGESITAPTIWNRAGFFWRVGTPGGSFFAPRAPGERTHVMTVGVPYWFITSIAAIPALGSAWRKRRRKSQRGFAVHASGEGVTQSGAPGGPFSGE